MKDTMSHYKHHPTEVHWAIKVHHSYFGNGCRRGMNFLHGLFYPLQRSSK